MCAVKKKIVWLLCSVCLCMCAACGKNPEMVLEGTEGSSAQREISAGEESAPEKEAGIFVYICGAVKHPGVYELDAGSRVYELVEKAGGMKKKADGQSVNLAETLTDGEMIQIPEISDQKPEQNADTGQDTDIGQDASGGLSADGRVDLNSASKEQLMTLPGIGESKAESIIAYRTDSGPFRAVEDIMNVSGIKEGTFEKLKDSITVQ